MQQDALIRPILKNKRSCVYSTYRLSGHSSN